MKKILKNFVKITYAYQKTQMRSKKFNALVLFSLKKKITLFNKTMQLSLIKSKMLPFFENLPNNKQIRPLFYSNNMFLFGALKNIARSCKGTVLVGKGVSGFIKERIEPAVNKKNGELFFVERSITLLIVSNSSLCNNAIKEAHTSKIVSFGFVHFDDKTFTDISYFVMGNKNSLQFSIQFFLLLQSFIVGKTRQNILIKKEQNVCFFKCQEYAQYLKNYRNVSNEKANLCVTDFVSKKKSKIQKTEKAIKKVFMLKNGENNGKTFTCATCFKTAQNDADLKT